MKVSITLKHQYILAIVSAIIILSGAIFVIGANPGSTPNPGHSGTEIADGSITGDKLENNISLTGNMSVDSPAFVVTGSQVGIGTASPLALLEVRTDQDALTKITLSNYDTGTSARAILNLQSDSASGAFGVTSAAYTGISGWEDSLYLASNSVASGGLILDVDGASEGIHFQVDEADKMTVAGSGRVGIGAVSPTTQLEVNGTVAVNKFLMVRNESENVVGYLGDGANLLGAGVNDEGLILRYENNLTISQGTTQRITVTGSGNMGIGTTNPNDGKVEVKGGTVCVDTNSDGSATSCISSESDIRLKKNIKPIESALDKIQKLEGVTFDWRWDEYEQIGRFKAKQQGIGLIAQDVEKVFPEAMNEDIGEYKSVDYKTLVAPLIEAVKELKAENDALKLLVCSDHPEAEFCN